MSVNASAQETIYNSQNNLYNAQNSLHKTAIATARLLSYAIQDLRSVGEKDSIVLINIVIKDLCRKYKIKEKDITYDECNYSDREY